MSLAQLSAPEHKPSQLNINLGSNNPFRNRAVSPSSPISPDLRPERSDRPERPRSTNPFLDNPDIMSPQSAPAGAVLSPSSDKHPFTGNTAELFENLSLKERRPAPPPPEKPSSSRLPATRQSTSRSRPEPRDRDRNRDQSSSKKPDTDPFDIFADPPKKKESSRPSRPREGRPRPRRNSESSIMEKPRAMDPEDERRRRERRQRDGKSSSKSKRAPGHRLDVIDKLDVTSIFGTGLFHHDGPFDACNPNRNRKGSRQAPMQAFPKDSKNMALGGAGPNNSRLNLDLIHGHTTPGYMDYATGVTKKDGPFDSARAEVIHGTESMGLGTSTFLEGTPASRAAMQRRQSESDQQPASGGLQRTKSLAQKFKGINRTGTVRVTSPDGGQLSPSSAGLPNTINRTQERNPVFQDYDDAYDQKGSRIEEAKHTRRSRASSSPRRTGTLERKTTEGSIGLDENKQNGGGFMNRMKSLRRPRPERRVPSE